MSDNAPILAAIAALGETRKDLQQLAEQVSLIQRRLTRPERRVVRQSHP